MKEVKRRKAHLPEFKAKVGMEALRGEKTVNQIGKLKVELDWLKKNPGSACHDQAKVDWPGWRRDPTPAGPAGRTRSTRSIPICCAG